MNPDLSVPAALIAERMGLQFPQDRWPDLARGLEKAGASLGFDSAHGFITHLLTKQFGQREVQALAASLTVAETHFFRSPETFAMFQSWLLPSLIAARESTTRTLRIWSAGCATGQEAFSIAILLSRLLGRLDRWDLTILATDINPDVFAVAKAAEYTQWSFRGTPSWVINGYFTKTHDGRHRLDPAIRDMVTFRYLNLAEDVYPSVSTDLCDFDLILCRNVIMYFSRAVAIQVAGRLQRSLREGGYLLLTPSESSRDVQHELTSLVSGGEIVYQKTPQLMSAVTAKEQAIPRPRLRLERRAAARPEPFAARPPKNDAPPPGRDGQARVKSAGGVGSNPADAARGARLLADKGELVPALKHCDDALIADKLNPCLYYLKASILQELGRTEEAERALQSTLFLDGSFAPARVMLGAIARGQSRSDEAARHFRAALSLLAQMPSDFVLPETDGLTAGEMADAVASLLGSECAL